MKVVVAIGTPQVLKNIRGNAMYWVLGWLVSLIAAILSGFAAIVFASIGFTEYKPGYIGLAVGLIFLTAFLGWSAWVCAAMS